MNKCEVETDTRFVLCAREAFAVVVYRMGKGPVRRRFMCEAHVNWILVRIRTEVLDLEEV